MKRNTITNNNPTLPSTWKAVADQPAPGGNYKVVYQTPQQTFFTVNTATNKPQPGVHLSSPKP